MHVLYRHWDAAGSLLYVGITGNLATRLRGHRHTASWFPEIANITLQHFPDNEALLAAERQAIAEENPIYNKRLKVGLRYHHRRKYICATCKEHPETSLPRCPGCKKEQRKAQKKRWRQKHALHQRSYLRVWRAQFLAEHGLSYWADYRRRRKAQVNLSVTG